MLAHEESSSESGHEEGWLYALARLDGDPGIAPQYHSYVDSKAVWETLCDDGLPRYPERRVAD